MFFVKSDPSWSKRAVTHSGLTPQQWEGAVLQLHDDPVQHRQHGGDVQQDQDDGLKDTHMLFIHSERGHEVRSPQKLQGLMWLHSGTLQGPVLLSGKPSYSTRPQTTECHTWCASPSCARISFGGRGLCCWLRNQSSGSVSPGPSRTHLPWRCCTAGSRQSGRQRQSPRHGLVQPGRTQTALVWLHCCLEPSYSKLYSLYDKNRSPHSEAARTQGLCYSAPPNFIQKNAFRNFLPYG